MEWVYKHPPLTIRVEFCDSRTRGSQLYGYLEAVVQSGDINMHKASESVSGFSLLDIEVKAEKLARRLAKQVMKSGGDFTPD